MANITAKPSKPWPTGEQISGWTILKHLGHGATHPGTGREYAKTHHWYEAECDCGAIEIRNAQGIMSSLGCTECIKAARRDQLPRSVRITNYFSLPPDVPDFAKMKL